MNRRGTHDNEVCELCSPPPEPGQISRRAFVKGSMAVVSVGMAMPSVFSRAVQTATTSRVAGPSFLDAGRVLIVVQMAGGNDGLNTVVPFTDPHLAGLRPTLVTREQDLAFKLNGALGVHPGLAAFKPLWDAGQLAVVSNVGYPDPSLSHFQSMDIWETMDPRERQGWLGRYLAGLVDKDGHPLSGIDVATNLSPALQALSAPVATLTSPQSFSLQGAGETPAQSTLLAATLDRLYKAYPKAAPYAAVLSQTEQNSFAAAKLLTRVGPGYQPKATYPPGAFGNGLKVLAESIVAGVGMRVGYITLGGFDTHRDQANQHAKLLALLSTGISALLGDLTAQGKADNVAVMTWSEFGRRPQENASLGTDHGTAAPLFVVGPGVKGGVYGDPPDLANLDANDNLKFHTDFRQVYATVLESWLKIPADTVIPAQYRPLPLLAG